MDEEFAFPPNESLYQLISLEIKSLGYCQSKELVFLLKGEGNYVLD